MSWVNLLTICISGIVGLSVIAGIFANSWVKTQHLAELKAYAKEEIECLRKEVNLLWEKVSKVEVLSSKIEAVEKGIERIERMLINSFEKRNPSKEK